MSEIRVSGRYFWRYESESLGEHISDDLHTNVGGGVQGPEGDTHALSICVQRTSVLTVGPVWTSGSNRARIRGHVRSLWSCSGRGRVVGRGCQEYPAQAGCT